MLEVGLGIVAWATFALKVWAFVDVLRHGDAAFRAAERLTRGVWAAVMIVAVALHLWVGGLAWGGLMGTVVALVYIADVRPRVVAAERDAA